MILILNFLFAAMAQKATWPQRILCLRAFLFYLMAFEVVGSVAYVYASKRWYWYTYWIARTVSFALQACVAYELAKRGRYRLPTLVTTWGGAILTLIVLIDLKFWFFNPTFEKTSFDLSLASASLISVTLLLALFLRPVNFRIWLGSALWVTITILSSSKEGHFLPYYPIASLAPLAIWSSCLIRRRGLLTIPQQKKDGYVTTERTIRGRESRLTVGKSRDVVAVLQRTTEQVRPELL